MSELSDFAMSDFERQLQSLAPREPAINRDELLFRAGYEAALAAKVDEASSLVKEQVSDVENLVSVIPVKTSLDPRIQWAAIVTLILVALTCGALGMQVGERRAVARQQTVKNSLKQLSGPGMVFIPSNPNDLDPLEPPPPVYATDDNSRNSFASSNEPNYIELRDQVLRFGVDALPENYSLAAPMTSSKERKPITPLSYGSVMELSVERY